MEISSTEKYLALVLGSLENTVMPELASREAKATAEIMKAVLLDLIKRERFTPRLLAEHIAEGCILARSMADLAAELEGGQVDVDAAERHPAPAASSGFNALAAQHRDLTAHIARLADRLATLRGKAGDSARRVRTARSHRSKAFPADSASRPSASRWRQKAAPARR